MKENDVMSGRILSATSSDGRPHFRTMDFARRVTGEENPRAVAANFFAVSSCGMQE